MQTIRIVLALLHIYTCLAVGVVDAVVRLVCGVMPDEMLLDDFVADNRLTRFKSMTYISSVLFSRFSCSTTELYPSPVMITLAHRKAGPDGFACFTESLAHFLGLREISRNYVYFTDGTRCVVCVMLCNDGYYYCIGTTIVSTLSSHDAINVGRIVAHKLDKQLDFVLRFEYHRLTESC